MSKCYEMVKRFKSKYPSTVAFRLARHCEVVDMHLNPDEEILYAFPAQKSSKFYEMFYTNVIALTNKRIIVATKRIVWGYFFISITPDMFNDLTIHRGLLWGSVVLDTVKEEVFLSHISRNALEEIETIMSEYMIKEKKRYAMRNRD